MKEASVAERLARHGAVPAVKDAKLAGECRYYGEHPRRKRTHDLVALGRVWSTPLEVSELALVVEHETVHRCLRPGLGGVVGRRHLAYVLGPIGFVDLTEQLSIDVRILFTRVGVGLGHDLVGRARVGVCVHHGAVAGSVAVLPKREAVELLARGRILGGVGVTEHVVEGTVLAHDYDEMIKPGCLARLRDRKLFRNVHLSSLLRAPCQRDAPGPRNTTNGEPRGDQAAGLEEAATAGLLRRRCLTGGVEIMLSHAITLPYRWRISFN